MKIHIMTKFIDGPWGGGNQFLKGLREYFRMTKCYVENSGEADVIIFNSYPFNHEFLLFKSLITKKRNKKTIFIHRVDGPISIVRGSPNYCFHDQVVISLNNNFSDGTIFQSEWSRQYCLMLGMNSNIPHTTIINAPDPRIFFPSKNKIVSDKILIVATSWSNNWGKGFDIYRYLDNNLDFSKYSFTFIGNSPISFKNIVHIKPLNSKMLAEELRKHQFFITASIDDPCSNSLIEALHSGLVPIVRDSGGHKEIVGDCGILFKGMKDVIKQIDLANKKFDYLYKRIKPHSINKIGESYLDFANELINKKNLDQTNIPPNRFLNSLILGSNLLLKHYFDYSNRNIFRYLPEKIMISPKSRLANNFFHLPTKEDISFSQISDLKLVIGRIRDFIDQMHHLKDSTLFRFTLTGDIQCKPSLAASVFASKIITMLDYVSDDMKKYLTAHISSFQREDGKICDPWIHKQLMIRYTKSLLKGKFYPEWNYAAVELAETRQSFAALACLGTKPPYKFAGLFNSQEKIRKYIHQLNWDIPWSAASQISHLLFFFRMEQQLFQVEDKKYEKFISLIIKEVNENYHQKDGSWGSHIHLPMQQKINGAMKMMTAFESANGYNIGCPEKLIDLCLVAIHNKHACDLFNIICVLYHCSRLTRYRIEEVKQFSLHNLEKYKKHYWHKFGGFSFYEHKAQDSYYDVKVSLGRFEPDMHGTVLLLWGIVLTTEILGWRDELGIKFPIN